MFRLLTSLLLVWTLRAAAAEPWLLTFPEIATDARHVFFVGEQWCGYLSIGLDAMLTVPRDSLNPPASLPDRIVSVLLKGDEYVTRGSEILRIRPPAPDSVYTMLPPSLESMRLLSQVVSPADLPGLDPVELTGPITASRSRVFFGLLLQDRNSGASTAGLGWIDPATRYLARIYSPLLKGMEPVWIDAIGDTVHALFAKYRKGECVRTVWVGCDALNPELFEVDGEMIGIPGNKILTMRRWHETIVLSTDRAVAIHGPNQTMVWDTRAYAPLESGWLYLRKFTEPGLGDTTRFLSLPKGRPTVVKAWIGDWMEVGAPDGIEGYVDRREWVADSSRWSLSQWDCEQPCFLRVRVPNQDTFIEGDLTDTPLTLLGLSKSGAKVGFRAAWIPARRLAPVLLPIR